jgi:hypothetical protein
MVNRWGQSEIREEQSEVGEEQREIDEGITAVKESVSQIANPIATHDAVMSALFCSCDIKNRGHELIDGEHGESARRGVESVEKSYACEVIAWTLAEQENDIAEQGLSIFWFLESIYPSIPGEHVLFFE